MGTACAAIDGLVPHGQSSASVNTDTTPELPPNTGGKAVVVVKEFQWAGGGQTATLRNGDGDAVWEFSVGDRQEYGMALSKLVESALTNSGYFAVLPRDVLGVLETENGLDDAGKTDPSQANHDGGLLRPDLIVSIYVQEFNPHAGGSNFCGASMGSVTKKLVGIEAGLSSETGRVVLQVQLINRKTGVSIVDNVVEGVAESSKWQIGGFGLGQGALAGGALSKWADKPMGAAIRKAVAAAVVEIQKGTPSKMYWYEE